MIMLVVIILIIAIGAFAYVSANTHNTRIECLSNSTLKNGDYVEIVLKDEYRNVYPDQNIDIKILDDSGWANKYNATTDSSGQANIALEGLENGNYTVHANFNGTMFLSSSKTVSDLEIYDGYG